MSENVSNSAIVFNIVYSLYKFLPWEDTRKKILSMDKLLTLVMKLLKSTNNKVIYVAMQFLEIVQLFEPMHSEKVKKKKFKIFNKEFINHVENLEKSEMDYGEEDI